MRNILVYYSWRGKKEPDTEIISANDDDSEEEIKE